MILIFICHYTFILIEAPPEQVGKLLFPTLGPGNPGGPTALETFHTRGKAVLCRESSGGTTRA